MPLLNNRPWVPTALSIPPGVSDTENVFHSRQTGEIFTSYEDYSTRLKLLQSRQWSSNGKTGLTYEEAMLEDKRAESWLKEFPKELEEPVLRAAHHSLLPLDELVNEIHSHHCSPTGSGKENLPGENGAPSEGGANCFSVPQDSIRCWLMKAAQKEDHGAKSVWVAKPEYQRQYSLAQQIPKDVADELAKADKAGAADSGTGSPSTSPRKRKAAAEVPSPEAEPSAQAAAPGKKAKAGAGQGAEEEDTWQPPPLKSVEEEEKLLKDGTHRQALFRVLKEAGSCGMTILQIIEQAKANGIRDYPDSHKRVLQQTLSTDPTFVRVKKSTYALRALMGDKPYEAIGRLPKSKQPKLHDGNLPNGSAQSPEQLSGHKGPASPAKKRAKAEEPAKDAADPEEPYVVPPVRSIEEEEQRLKPGTNKAVIFEVLKGAEPEGMTIQDIVNAAKDRGLKEFVDSQKGAISAVLVSDPAFVRVRKGLYALRALMEDKPYEDVGRPGKRQKPNKDKLATDPAAEASSPAPLQPPATTPSAQEVESLTETERAEKEAKQAAERLRQGLVKALEIQQKAQARMEQAVQEPRSPSKKAFEDALGPAPNWQLTHDQKRFKGDPESKEDIAKHRARMAGLVAQQEATKREWQEKLAEAREKDAKASGHQEISKAQRALKTAQTKVALTRTQLAAAEVALKDAVKAAVKERNKKAADDRKAEEKKLREEARNAERERKKAEALEAKRYPMEDLQLLRELQDKAAAQGDPPPRIDVPLPAEWLSLEDSNATAGLLYVADLVRQFSKLLKVKSPGYQELISLLEEGTSPAGQEPAGFLWELYSGLLRFSIKESDEDEREQEWLQLLSLGTVGEVLRRHLEGIAKLAPELLEPGVASIARLLTHRSLDTLTGQQHQQLLSFLCDDALDGESMREALQQRLEESGDVKREMRGAVAEKRGELKELLDADKEERRKKREEKAAKKAKEEVLKKAQEEAAAGTSGSEPAEAALGQLAQDLAAEQGSNKKAEEEEAEEEEPSWELPTELQEFQGDPMDRKGMLEFRQKQQSARQKLEKAKDKWRAAALRRARAKEARQKAAADAERAKAKAMAAAEEEVARQQEAYERELEKFNVRRAPLGEDRMQRKYWWGVAGQRSHVYVEDESGQWAVWRTKEELDALMAALDKRGVRELALLTALEKAYDPITQAMKRAQTAGAKARPTSAETGTRFPKRERNQAIVFSPSKEDARQQQAGGKPDVLLALGGLTGASLAAIVTSLGNLQREMSSWGVDAPEQGWKSWGQAYKHALREATTAYEEEGTFNSVVGALKTCLLEAEDMLQLGSEPSGTDADSSDGNIEASEELEGGSKKAKTGCYLWKSLKQRASWRVGVMEGETLASVAYLAAQLEVRGIKLLGHMQRPKSAAKDSKKANAKKPSASPAKPRKAASAREERVVEASAARQKAESRPDKPAKAEKKISRELKALQEAEVMLAAGGQQAARVARKLKSEKPSNAVTRKANGLKEDAVTAAEARPGQKKAQAVSKKAKGVKEEAAEARAGQKNEKGVPKKANSKKRKAEASPVARVTRSRVK